MSSTLIRIFIYSAGALLFAMASAAFMTNSANAGFGTAHDPILMLTIRQVFWIIGGMLLFAALLCLFGRQTRLQLIIILWLATNVIVYQIGMNFMGAKRGVQGYLGEMADNFGVSTSIMAGLLSMAVWYLLIGSLIAMTLVWLLDRMQRANPGIKIACAHCGGRIAFSASNLGQKILCPHCQKEMTLRRPDLLKISCYFCKGHIEFPSHAIGEKMPCPHCKMDITLKEPA